MPISKELLEKYHLNECTSEERAIVEAWLLSDDTETLELPEWEDKTVHKAEMWKEISTVLPPAPAKNKYFFTETRWKRAIAACILLPVLVVLVYRLVHYCSHESIPNVIVNNTSSLKVQFVDSRHYNLTVGPKTQANINCSVIDFSGSLLISPKEDIELSFKGHSEKISFKRGQTYIVLNSRLQYQKIIVISQKNLMDMPPVLQKQIIHEFNI